MNSEAQRILVGYIGREEAEDAVGESVLYLRLLVSALETPDEGTRRQKIREACETEYSLIGHLNGLSALTTFFCGSVGALGKTNVLTKAYADTHHFFLETEFLPCEIGTAMSKGGLLHAHINAAGRAVLAPLTELSPFEVGARKRRERLVHYLDLIVTEKTQDRDNQSATEMRLQHALSCAEEIRQATQDCAKAWEDLPEESHLKEAYGTFEKFLVRQRATLLDDCPPGGPLETESDLNLWKKMAQNAGRKKYPPSLVASVLDDEGNLLPKDQLPFVGAEETVARRGVLDFILFRRRRAATPRSAL